MVERNSEKHMSTLIYFLIITIALFGSEYLLRKRFTERSLVSTSIDALLWTALFATVKNLYLFIAGGFTLTTFTQIFLISKLYPTMNSRLFTKEKKNDE